VTSCYGTRIEEWNERRIDRVLAVADLIWLAITAWLLFSTHVFDPQSTFGRLIDLPFFLMQFVAIGIWRHQRTAFAIALALSLWGLVGFLIALTVSVYVAGWLVAIAICNGAWSVYRLKNLP
jgi:hypothetical protein